MASPTLEMQRRLEEWATWYHYHAPTVCKSEDLKQVSAFFMKALDGLFELNAYAIDSLYELENGAQVKLLIPKGMTITGDLRNLKNGG